MHLQSLPLRHVIRFRCLPSAACGHFGYHRVHKIGGISRPDAICEQQKEDKGTNGGLDNCEKENQSKQPKEMNGSEQHHECPDEGCESRSQNRRTKMRQSVFCSCMAVGFAG